MKISILIILVIISLLSCNACSCKSSNVSYDVGVKKYDTINTAVGLLSSKDWWGSGNKQLVHDTIKCTMLVSDTLDIVPTLLRYKGHTFIRLDKVLEMDMEFEMELRRHKVRNIQ